MSQPYIRCVYPHRFATNMLKEGKEIKRRKDGGVEAPVSLIGFFNHEDDEKEDGDEGNDSREQQFEQIYDEQELLICSHKIIIRQYCWHQANANKVWPGTFNLAEFMEMHATRYSNGMIVELGAATGALSVYLKSTHPEYELYTSDIDDGGEVEDNIKYNFHRNGLTPVPHIPHTWGDIWPEEKLQSLNIRYIIASDILLYVSAYPALIQTLVYLFFGSERSFTSVDVANLSSSLTSQSSHPIDESLTPYVINVSPSSQELFYKQYDLDETNFSSHPPTHTIPPPPPPSSSSPSVPSSTSLFSPPSPPSPDSRPAREPTTRPQEFLMSWNRRISESYKFFQMMKEAGFICYHHGKCIYSFVPHR